MDNTQKEQLKKGLVFSGLGLLCVLSIWFIFAPSIWFIFAPSIWFIFAPSDKDKAQE